MSETHRLQDKLAKLGAAAEGADSGGRNIRAADKKGLLFAILHEIDEAILGRELTFLNDAGSILVFEVAARRLLGLGEQSGAAKSPSYDTILKQSFSEPSETLFDATIDADGYIIIRDRSKDIIKSGGEWISTVELENIATAHPGVANAAAIAARHEKWDERPILIVVKAEGADPSEAELLAFYDGKVASWQVPDAVIFVDDLPLGATGKVLKIKLREKFGEHLIENKL